MKNTNTVQLSTVLEKLIKGFAARGIEIDLRRVDSQILMDELTHKAKNAVGALLYNLDEKYEPIPYISEFAEESVDAFFTELFQFAISNVSDVQKLAAANEMQDVEEQGELLLSLKYTGNKLKVSYPSLANMEKYKEYPADRSVEDVFPQTETFLEKCLKNDVDFNRVLLQVLFEVSQRTPHYSK